jgi:isopropylmalate/homocitrate/citramalate synthase
MSPVELQEPLNQLARGTGDFLHDLRFPPPEEIEIYDDTLRDGEQTPGVAFSPSVKYEIARALSDVGVHVVYAGFPNVAPSERETLRLMLEGKRRGELRSDLLISCLLRATREDVEATAEAVVAAGGEPCDINFACVSAGSDLHVKYKVGRNLLHRAGHDESDWLRLPLSWYREANARTGVEAIARARSLGARHIEFGPEDASRADVRYLAELFKRGVAAGATRLCIADTVGCYSPYAVRHDVSYIAEAVPGGKPGMHMHNDLGLAAWNTVVGLGSGARYFNTSINGLGERAGNASLHQVLVQLRYLFGIELPGVKYEKLRDLADLVERLSGLPVQPMEPAIGRNVFKHESGMHTAAMLIHPKIYQFIPPEDVGTTISYAYGKHSGAALIEHALRSAGLDHSRDVVTRVTNEVKRIREERAETADFESFQAGYERHVDGLGVTLREVVELGRALTCPPAHEEADVARTR